MTADDPESADGIRSAATYLAGYLEGCAENDPDESVGAAWAAALASAADAGYTWPPLRPNAYRVTSPAAEAPGQ